MVVFGRCLVEGNEGAHNSIARGRECASGRWTVSAFIKQSTVRLQQERAATIPLSCKVYSREALKIGGGSSPAIWQLRSSHSELYSVEPSTKSRLPKTQIFHASDSSSLHRQHHKHYLTAALSSPMARAVFALRVEETRPMAGRPIWINSF